MKMRCETLEVQNRIIKNQKEEIARLTRIVTLMREDIEALKKLEQEVKANSP